MSNVASPILLICGQSKINILQFRRTKKKGYKYIWTTKNQHTPSKTTEDFHKRFLAPIFLSVNSEFIIWKSENKYYNNENSIHQRINQIQFSSKTTPSLFLGCSGCSFICNGNILFWQTRTQVGKHNLQYLPFILLNSFIISSKTLGIFFNVSIKSSMLSSSA